MHKLLIAVLLPLLLIVVLLFSSNSVAAGDNPVREATITWYQCEEKAIESVAGLALAGVSKAYQQQRLFDEHWYCMIHKGYYPDVPRKCPVVWGGGMPLPYCWTEVGR